MPVDAGTIYSEVRIRLDKLQADINSLDARFDQFGKKNTEQSTKVKNSWTKNFKQIGLAGVAAFAAIGLAVKQSIDIFAKYEQSMANVASVTDATADEFKQLEDAAITAGETTRFTASQAADAMYFLASAGLDATQTINALDGVLQLAGATQSELASTSAIMAATLSQFSLEAEESARVSNVFAAAISNSQANMEKLGSALKQVGPISGALGISLEETTASLEALFNAGFAGEQAGTGLRNILLELSNSSGPVVKKLEQVGVVFEKINPKKVGLTGAIEELAASGVDLGAIFGKRVAAQMLVLAKTGGDALRELQAEITDTNSAAELYAIQNDTLAGSIDFLNSAVQSAQIQLVEELAPALRGIIDFLTSAVAGFNSLPGPVKLAVSIFAAGIPIVTGLAAAIGILAAALGGAAGPITLVVGGIALLSGVIAGVNSAIDSYNNRFTDAADATEKQRLEVSELLKKYDTLKKESKENKTAQEELKRVIGELAGILPDATIEFNEYGEAIGISREKAEQYSKELLQNNIDLLESDLKLRSEELKTISLVIAEKQKLIEKAREDVEAAGENHFRRLRFEKLLLDAQKEQGQLVEERIKKSEEVAAIETELAELRIQADPILKKQFEDEQKRLKEEAEAREKEAADLAALNLQREKEAQAELERQKEYKELREQFRFESLTEEQQALEELDKLRALYAEAGVDTEEWYQQRRKEIYEKFNKEDKKIEDDKIDRTKELIALKEQYRQKLEDMGKTTIELIELERERQIEAIVGSDAEVEATEEEVEAKKNAIAAVNEYYDALKDNTANQIFKDNLQSVSDFTLNTFSEMFGAIAQLQAAITRERLKEIDRQLKAELEAAGLAEQTELERLNEELIAAQEAGDSETEAQLEEDIKRLEIEKEYEKKKAQIQYEGELKAWKFKLADAIIGTATAALNAYQSAAAIPVIGFVLGPIAAAAAAAFGAIKIAAVRKQKPKPPSFQSGGIVVPSGSSEGTIARVAEGGSAEVLFNNSDAGRPFLRQFAEEMAGIVIERLGNTNDGIINLRLYLDGKTVAESSANYYNNGLVRLKI